MQDARARQRALLDLPQDQGLYSFRNEHDACGVGLVAHLDNQASHAIIANGLTVLKRLMHRGAAGGDPETGDGAGLLFAIPDKFFRKHLGAKLPAKGRYGVAMVFGGEGAEADLERIAASEGLGAIAWREVPTDPGSIGRAARESRPRIRQLFLDGASLPDTAALERNGLRPARYTLTRDNLFVLASETGVLDIPASDVVEKGRIGPGEMIWCDLERGRLVHDTELKNAVARQRPYRRWAEENKIAISGLFDSVNAAPVRQDLPKRQRVFGWSREDLEVILLPMAAGGEEPIGSMGNDAALAVLSTQPQPLFNYFKQLFAQVTNPPIDPIREALVMSLTTYIGNQGDILSEEAHRASVVRLQRPVLTDEDIHRLGLVNEVKMSSATIALGWRDDLEAALGRLRERAVAEAKSGRRILILSDRELPAGEMPIPSLLATAAVNRALIEAGLRPPVGIVVQSGEVREVMHYALLLGYGATAIHPYLALETVSALAASGRTGCDPAKAAEHYIKAVDKGLLKVMSKMGISTLRSYRSAQIFEAVGIASSVVERYFPGTASRIGGIGMAEIAAECTRRHEQAEARAGEEVLPAGGQYRFRQDGENHLWSPQSLSLFRQAVQTNDVAKYRQYAALINEQAERLCTLRGLFEFAEAEPVPLEEVESVECIVRRFVSGAMSLGSLSPEAHEAIAIAMNRLGGMSNSGEGGEDPDREIPGPGGEDRRSAIRQVASGRFGVTISYLAGAKELQIKMAQGAKPGEGGQLPGHKVDATIARVRHATPYVTLISPPPHHDIYSIEDLAQLIYDLHNANRDARVSVKLVSEVGVGTIAAGVAKAHAEAILVSGHGGDTGSDCVGTSNRHGAESVTQIEIMPKPPAARADATPWPDWPSQMRTSSSHEEGCLRRWSLNSLRFLGEDGRVRGVEVCQVAWELSPAGRPLKFTPVEGTREVIPCDLVLLALGFVKQDRAAVLGKLGIPDSPAVVLVGDAALGPSLVVRALAQAKEAVGKMA